MAVDNKGGYNRAKTKYKFRLCSHFQRTPPQPGLYGFAGIWLVDKLHDPIVTTEDGYNGGNG